MTVDTQEVETGSKGWVLKSNVARVLNVPEPSLYDWVKNGLLPERRIENRNLVCLATAERLGAEPRHIKGMIVDGKEYLTLTRACNTLGIPIEHPFNCVRGVTPDPLFPSVITRGTRTYVSLADLDKWAARRGIHRDTIENLRVFWPEAMSETEPSTKGSETCAEPAAEAQPTAEEPETPNGTEARLLARLMNLANLYRSESEICLSKAVAYEDLTALLSGIIFPRDTAVTPAEDRPAAVNTFTATLVSRLKNWRSDARRDAA